MNELLPYAPLILKLLQGVIYHDDNQWELLIDNTIPLTRHFMAIGLRLHIDESEGFAYLSQPEQAEGMPPLPRLVRRVPLTYDATLLAVLLRESLQQFDAQSPEATRHILSRAEIMELMGLFLPEQSDMTRLERRVENGIRQLAEAGFIRQLKREDEALYEIRRIIKAKLSAEQLVEIRQRLRDFVAEDGVEE